MHKPFAFLFLSFSATCYGQVTNKQSLPATNPMLFVENKGQVLDFDNQPRPDILYMLKGGGVNVFVGQGELHYLFSQKKQNPQEIKKLGFGKTEAENMNELDLLKGKHLDTTHTETETYRIDLALEGMNPAAIVEAGEPNAYYENYYNIPGHYQDGILNVRSFGRIVMRDVYPNIDWVLYTKNGKLKHEFILHPGANFKDIKLRIKGADAIAVNELGELEINTPLGSIVEDKPEILSAHNITANFVVKANAFKDHLVEYQLNGIPEDFGSDIIIDPGVVWSTYFGGNGGDYGYAVSYDSLNDLFISGITGSSSGLSKNGFQNKYNGSVDWFISKFTDYGIPAWSTYYGGSDDEYLYTIFSDPAGNLIVGGNSTSKGIAYKGFDTIYSNIGQDALIVFFNSSGYRTWATYYGGNGDNEFAYGAFIKKDKIFICGQTFSTDGIASKNAFQTTYGGSGNGDGFIVSFDTVGKRNWGTYFGGSGADNALDLDVDDNYNIYVSGFTNTTGLGYKGYQNSLIGAYDAFLIKMDSSGNRKWFTYIGGNNRETARNVSVHNNTIYALGWTESNTSFPLKNGLKNTLSGKRDCFISQFDTGCNLLFSTYFGVGSDEEILSGFVDKRNSIWFWGYSTATASGFGKNGIYDNSGGLYSTFLAQIDSSRKLNYCTYYPGYFYEFLAPGSLTGDGKYVYSISTSDNTTKTIRSRHQSNCNGTTDALFTKWSLNNFSKPYLTNAGNICQNTKLNIISTQYGVGRGSTAKTLLELSDTSGKFNANTTTIFTRNDTLSQYDSVFYTIPYTVKPGKNYRIRARMVYPPDTSEASNYFEIHAGPTGQILTPSSNTFCERDSIKLELDTVGKNKLRWYRINSPTNNAADTNRFFWAKLAGKHYLQLTNKWSCTYNTNAINFIVNPRPFAGFKTNYTEQCFVNNLFNFTDTSKAGAGDNITQRGWNFGDGNSSTGSSASKQYTKFGKYTIRYGLLTGKGCKDSAFLTIHVKASPVAKIYSLKTKACIFNNQFALTDSTQLGEGNIAIRAWYVNGNYLDSQKIQNYHFGSTGLHKVKLMVTSNLGCIDSAVQDFKIYSSPVAVITSSKTEFCQGDSSKLVATDNPSWTYQWKRNNTLINGSTAKQWYVMQDGNYAVKVTTSDGCDTISNSIAISINPLPKPNLGADLTMPNGGNKTLDPGVFNTYNWNKGASTQTLLVDKTNLDTGKNLIWVKVTDAKGCEASDSIIITLLAPNTGLLNPNIAGIKVYPVPMKQTLQIELPLTITSNGIYLLSDMQGKIVRKGTLIPHTFIDVASLSEGVYLLVLELDGARYGVRVER